MNEIKVIAAHRPEIDPLTDHERHHLWATVSGEKLDRLGGLDDIALALTAVEPVYLEQHRRSAARRRPMMAAAAAVAVLGVGGLVAVNGRGGEGPVGAPAASPGTSAAPANSVTPVILIPESLSAAGLRLPNPGLTSIRDEPSGFQRRVFGAADDPADSTRMIDVEYAVSESKAIPCHNMPPITPEGAATPSAENTAAWIDGATPFAGAIPFDVGGTTGHTCTDYGPLTAGWVVDGVTVELHAGTAVTREQLVEFAGSLRTTPATTAGGPPVDLVADPIPTGWAVLVGEDVPYAQRITESAWMASVGGADDDPRQLVVQTWTGVDAQGIYAKQPPIGAEPITIRGHDGYVYESDQAGGNGPQQLDIWWTEQPGMVVEVSATDLYPAARVIEIIEQMVPVDAAGFATFSADPSNY